MLAPDPKATVFKYDKRSNWPILLPNLLHISYLHFQSGQLKLGRVAKSGKRHLLLLLNCSSRLLSFCSSQLRWRMMMAVHLKERESFFPLISFFPSTVCCCLVTVLLFRIHSLVNFFRCNKISLHKRVKIKRLPVLTAATTQWLICFWKRKNGMEECVLCGCAAPIFSFSLSLSHAHWRINAHTKWRIYTRDCALKRTHWRNCTWSQCHKQTLE